MFEDNRNETFDARELRVLEYWKNRSIFERSVEERADKPLFSFYDGPPFATGLPHYGHYLAGTIKDVVLRYKTMKGFRVPRRFGWDCHGLPIENEIEKAQQLSGAASIEEFGVARFNEECRKIVLRYTEEWKALVTRMGRWVDFSSTYRTMDISFMESVWWVFKELFDKGLVYEGYKVMPFSAKLGTPLSNFEAGENYKDVDDPSLTIALPLVDDPNTSLMIWTTTPWTLISNLAVMAGPSLTYVKVRNRQTDKQYILAESRLGIYDKQGETYEVIEKLDGKALEGLCYTPPFDYFVGEKANGAFRVILDDGVTIDEGTGLVHCAPAFGEADFYACQRAGIPLVCPVNSNGLFTKEIAEYEGQFVKDADKDIIKRLKAKGVVIDASTLRHRYPFCWRSDTPLIYKAVRTWFIAVEKIKPDLLASNEQIHWTPAYLKHGRFGKWLEGARDWAISRNRYWGTPIPIWRAEDGEVLVMGSIADLEGVTGAKVTDLHRHFIDDLTIERNGKVFKRIPEVFDCWFESGSMPYAQNHYPFENKELFTQGYPADFIGEGLDQTRGWFYTLTVLSTALFKKPAFKNVIVNGIILAEDGTKMSKRLKNYPDPSIVVHKHGADAVRLYMMHSPAVKADDLCFAEIGVDLVLKQILIPLWNSHSFLATYAKIYKWQPTPPPKKPQNVIDQWILSLLNKLVKDVEEGMNDYDLSRAVEPFVKFVDQLTNWYIRRSRRRFWDEKPSVDREEAFATLYHVILTLVEVAAPFVPFISEAIYLNLRTDAMPESVHLGMYPAYNSSYRNESLETAMEAVQTVVSLGHGLRKEHKLKVRQPLSAAHIVTKDAALLKALSERQHLIADELNVKQVHFESDETPFVSLKAKANFRVLGKKVGKHMRGVQAAIDEFTQNELNILLKGENVTVHVEGEAFVLTPEDVAVERLVRDGVIAANAGAVTIALDTVLTDDLIVEALAREIVNKVNSMRRDAGFAVTDRIHITLDTTPKVKQALEVHGDMIRSEVLALSVRFEPCQGTAWDLNGEPATIALEKDGGD
jgi:isoleucyl-tRNA synthetase